MDVIDRASERIETERAKHESELQKYVQQLDDAEAKIRARNAALAAEMRANAEEHGNPDASGDDIIEINAGGKFIVVRRDKLCQIKSSRLAALFSGRWDSKWPRDGAGRVFLDVNPACFQALVDYLNELAISTADNMPKGPSVDDEDEGSLRQMLHMFGLCDYVEMHPQVDSDIVNTESKEETLCNWLHEEGEDGHLRLLYRLSRDLPNLDPNDPHATDPGPHSFHLKCDNQGATVCLFKIGEGRAIVGGYSSVPWTDGAEFSPDDKAFIFYIEDGEGGEEGEKRKMKLKNPSDPKAVLGQNCMGPIFGDDLTPINAQPHFFLYFSPGRRYEASGHENIDYMGNLDDNGYAVEEMEVYQVQKRDEFVSAITIDAAESFSEGINEALNEKLAALQQAERLIGGFEREFVEEMALVQFLEVDANDIIELNVSGTQMATRRSTLQFCKDCTLARQFDEVWDESRASQEGATLIEHSPYCFGKILDFLRLRALHAQKLCKEPGRPQVRESERERFEKIVDYYFPGDASKYVLG